MPVTTCQVCGRTVKASKGLIAHHGYRRPYEGFQTASCEGARYVPYEVSCDRLREVTEMVRQFIARQQEMLADFLGNPPQTLTETVRRSSWDKQGTDYIYTRPDTFNAEKYYSGIPRTYENAFDGRKTSYERTIRLATLDLETMERRLREWVSFVRETA
jgi:hypothetical protein